MSDVVIAGTVTSICALPEDMAQVSIQTDQYPISYAHISMTTHEAGYYQVGVMVADTFDSDNISTEVQH